MVRTMIQDGVTQPMVAMMAPPNPAILMPTNVDELIAIGPGVICEIVTMSTNSFMDSQWFRSTTCF